MNALTPRQTEILAVIRNHLFAYGTPPTLREIGAVVGIRSTNGVHEHLAKIERKGYIKLTGLKSRSIQIVDRGGPCCPLCGHTQEAGPA